MFVYLNICSNTIMSQWHKSAPFYCHFTATGYLLFDTSPVNWSTCLAVSEYFLWSKILHSRFFHDLVGRFSKLSGILWLCQTKEVWHPLDLPVQILVAGEDEMAEVSVLRKYSHEQHRVHICRLMFSWMGQLC